MSSLRDEIRAILHEEIAALRAETKGGMPQPSVERVTVSSGAELTRFAQNLVQRASDPAFAERVIAGEVIFEPAVPPANAPAPIVTGPARKPPERLDKGLVTERDIAELEKSARILRIAPHSRLTPLARDEARRRGIRIERGET